ncbi:MAG: agmatine deiminase family protein [Streptosporangiaceae bacterium]
MNGRAADQARTPRADGFRMPAEWEPHQCCFMAWPTRTSLWGELFDQAKRDYADVARAIAGFEPVVMICQPGDTADVRRYCGSAVQATEIAIDDSWTRDNGPVFVVNERGEVAAVNFGFNSWGGKYLPYDQDAALGTALADVLGTRCYQAPFVLEGGSFYVDGEGTLFTTEGPVLDPARNHDASRELFEQVVGEYLAIDSVLWLVAYPDRDTDGHIDGIAQLVGPAQILLLTPDEPAHPNYPYAGQNMNTLTRVADARGRNLQVIPFGITASAPAGGESVDVPYLNCYLANGGVVVPLAGAPEDELALSRLREVFAGREVIGVPGATLSYGGGGPHCITQQMPLGRAVPA